MARWHSCNILHLAPDAKRLWQFEAKGKGFALKREQRVPHADPLPAHLVAKSWTTLWQPKLNVAWLPTESVFLRVVDLPAANLDETFSMVELQLEKLSPIPTTQVAWTMQVLGTRQSPPKPDGTVESLQTVIVVIAARDMVAEFLGRLEREGYQSDRLEVPMLDQLAAVEPKTDSVWLFPLTLGGQNAALVAWWFGGTWRSLNFVTLPATGDRAAELKTQLSLLAMGGEVEGWLTGQPEWHLVADPVNATDWEQLLRTGLGEPVKVVPPPAPADLAVRSAQRAAEATGKVNLQPPEFSARYREQFFDRLWLRALVYAGVVYALIAVAYICAGQWEGYKAHGVESELTGLGPQYTNAIELEAKLDVLQRRSELKFAALDCWQATAEELPATVTLNSFSFVAGQKLHLSGTSPKDQVNILFDFNDALKKKKLNNQPLFDPNAGAPVNPHGNGNSDIYSWSMDLQLMHAAQEEK
jgi:hypothetical protein